AVLTVAHAAADLGWHPAGVVRSPLPGPAGNVEFFLWLRSTDAATIDDGQMAEIVTAEEAP
ncbi:MAG: rRNA (cytidine1920-2-O)/16S rRNA (cytidine1409-2-O)-methyltransferase, partial [Pseudonocardiales bacterium]|nr:rRNA (cytidine1920-2-O)/16S rRNA (cytidine1409-2-O)-methyltransferase [Pseudonocardiales bacterium]